MFKMISRTLILTGFLFMSALVFAQSECNESNYRDFIYTPGVHNCDLRGGDFKGADCREANFAGADLRETNFEGADCRGADFTGARLIRAWLKEGNFSEANFSVANFFSAYCRGANFSKAIFSKTIFTNADCREANFNMAVFRDVTKFEGAFFNNKTTMVGAIMNYEFREYVQSKGAILDFTFYDRIRKGLRDFSDPFFEVF